MTEEEFESDQRPDVVLHSARDSKLMNSRKARLFACGCFRLIWDRITLPGIKEDVELAEARADRQVKQSDLRNRRFPPGDSPPNSPDWFLRLYVSSILGTKITPEYMAWVTRVCFHPELWYTRYSGETNSAQANLARDIFGNPFRSVAFDPNWQTATAVGLAQTMYDARDFGAMPILADALQDAGCEDESILTHCRDANQAHVRGCWVVDAILGRS